MLALSATGLDALTRVSAAEKAPAEYDVKAAFVYNFLPFVEWPTAAFAGSQALRMCVVGDHALGTAFDGLAGQEVMGRKLIVTHDASIEGVGRCHILFIGRSEDKRLSEIMGIVKGTGALTIGDGEGFAKRGVIINFYLEQKKVRFEINAAAARQAGISISAKLMKLAGAVYGATGAGD